MKKHASKGSSVVKRTKAKAEVFGGAIQEAVGHVLGDGEMKAKGAAHQLVGRARDEAARSDQHDKGVIEEAVGAAMDDAATEVHDPKAKIGGKLVELKGKVRQILNQ